mgnify:CR=1 FL=1
MLAPWDYLFDALHFAAKANPQQQDGQWPVGAALVPETVRKYAPRAVPSTARALLAFAGSETMRLRLPLVAPTRAVVAAVHDTVAAALLSCTATNRAGLLVPVSTASHDTTQLRWGRCRRNHPDTIVPLCRYNADCDAHCVTDSRGRLGVYLTPSEQTHFDATGEVPAMALFCLLCIRRDAQAIYMMHQSMPVNPSAELGRPALLMPPFQNLVGVEDGYKASVMATPSAAMPAGHVAIVGVVPGLAAHYDPHQRLWGVDQTHILFGSHLNGRAAA